MDERMRGRMKRGFKLTALPEEVKSAILNGLTRQQSTFLLEKLVGLNDKEAALAAGYSLSVAVNTKQKIWKPEVRLEYERLRLQMATYWPLTNQFEKMLF